MHTKQTVEVQGNPMEILIFEPAGEGPVPGIMVAQHLPVAHMGLEKDPFTLDVGKRLAEAGYACVIPYMFHWWPSDEDIAVKRDSWRDDWAVADMDAAHTLLTGLDRVDAGRIGILGHCWGGRGAWLGACHNPNYKAVGVFYGGRIKVAMGEGSTPPIELADRIAGDVIGVFGNEDQNPTPADVDDLDAALTAVGVVHAFHRYDDAGHGFQDFTDDSRYRADATVDAWEKVVAYFNDRLK